MTRRPEPEMCSGLSAYAHACPGLVDGVLKSYNGDGVDCSMPGYTTKHAAIDSMNILFNTVKSEKKQGQIPEGSARNMGYGVGISELASAARIGTALMRKLGVEEGRSALSDLIRMMIRNGGSVYSCTPKQAIGMYERNLVCPMPSHDALMHGGIDDLMRGDQ